MTDQLSKVEGKDLVTFLRLFKERKTVKAALLPYQTGMSFGVSHDSDSTSTKDGAQNSQSSLTTDFSVDYLDNTSVIADKALTAAISGERVEAWRVNRNRRNADGAVEAFYVQGFLSENSGDADSDSTATRSLTIMPDGEPKRGWLKLDDETEELIDYVFHGLGVVADDETTATGVGEGTAWTDADYGVNAEEVASTTPKTPAADEGTGAE